MFDDALPGFGIRKFPNGNALYFVKFNIGPQQRRMVLGSALVRGVLGYAQESGGDPAQSQGRRDVVNEARVAEARARAEREARRTSGHLVTLYPSTWKTAGQASSS